MPAVYFRTKGLNMLKITKDGLVLVVCEAKNVQQDCPSSFVVGHPEFGGDRTESRLLSSLGFFISLTSSSRFGPEVRHLPTNGRVLFQQDCPSSFVVGHPEVGGDRTESRLLSSLGFFISLTSSSKLGTNARHLPSNGRVLFQQDCPSSFVVGHPEIGGDRTESRLLSSLGFFISLTSSSKLGPNARHLPSNGRVLFQQDCPSSFVVGHPEIGGDRTASRLLSSLGFFISLTSSSRFGPEVRHLPTNGRVKFQQDCPSSFVVGHPEFGGDRTESRLLSSLGFFISLTSSSKLGPCSNKKAHFFRSGLLVRRGGRIRTCDPLFPKQVR